MLMFGGMPGAGGAYGGGYGAGAGASGWGDIFDSIFSGNGARGSDWGSGFAGLRALPVPARVAAVLARAATCR